MHKRNKKLHSDTNEVVAPHDVGVLCDLKDREYPKENTHSLMTR